MKRILSLLTVMCMLFCFVSCGGSNDNGEAYTFGLLIYKYDDTYISTVRTALQKYAEQNKVKIKLDMQDAQGDQARQNDQFDVLMSKGVDIIMVNPVDADSVMGLATKAKSQNVPILFFNREPDADVMKACDGLFIGTTASEAGIMQGDLMTEIWRSNGKYDRNNDSTCQYVVLKGEPANPEAEARTSYCVTQMEKNGIKMQNINPGGALVANWMTDQAQSQMEAVLAANESRIEAVFCNNDDMALGVIAALNNIGYNMSANSDKWIPVIGVDATNAGVQAIQSGKMAATVKQDGDAMGKAIIDIAVNVVQGKKFTEDTDYEIADDGVSVRIPYVAYRGESE